MKINNLEKLENPNNLADKLDLKNLDKDKLISLLSSMLKIRLVERKLAEEKKKNIIIGPVHLAIGQEAIGAGVSLALNKNDIIYGTHRSHSHIIPLGTNLFSFFSEILGRSSGLCGGMGGSMHLQDKENGFMGSVPIVAATVPLAVGSALSIKMDKRKSVAVAYLGDGAMEEGIVHESLNLSSILNVPVIFVIENNLFASHMHIDTRQTQSACVRFAKANGIDHFLVDGNDVISVYNSMTNLVQSSKDQNKPGLIEAVTYRWLGHVDWREDIDVGVNRSKKELEMWKNKDPIMRLINGMVDNEIIDDNYLAKASKEISKEINYYWELALESAYPKELPEVFF